MFRRRRKMCMVLLATVFLLVTCEMYYLRSSADIPTFYMSENEANEFLLHASNAHSNLKAGTKNHALNGMNNAMAIEANLQDKVSNQSQSLYAPKLSAAEKGIAYELLSVLHKTMLTANLTYWIYSGTLLGSYRHHDLIPWDDDVDVFTDIATRDTLISELTKLKPQYTVFVAGNRLKFYLTSAVKTSEYPWTFPYIDISFYKDNGTTLYDYSDNQDMGDFMFVYAKSTVFPLHLRPLGELLVNAPRDTLANLRATYPNLGLCHTPHYQHRSESLISSVQQQPCESLKHAVPFVHRTPAAQQGVEETLKLGEQVIQTILVDEPPHAITDPYTLQLLQTL